MIYEMRSYEVVPGRMPAMNARFQNHTVGLFEKHGIKVIGFWEAVVGTSNVLHYMVAFEDLAHRERAWASFQAEIMPALSARANAPEPAVSRGEARC